MRLRARRLGLVFTCLVASSVVFVTPAWAPENCQNLWIEDPHDEEVHGVDEAVIEVSDIHQGAQSETQRGVEGRILAPVLSDDVQKRIIRSVVIQEDLAGDTYWEWGWLRDPGTTNIETFWAVSELGHYADNRSNVYTYSAHTFRIEIDYHWFTGRPAVTFFIDGSETGGLSSEHESNMTSGYQVTLAERWNSCDPREATFDLLTYWPFGTSSWRGWRELKTATGRYPDASTGCYRIYDYKWKTVIASNTSSPCQATLDFE